MFLKKLYDEVPGPDGEAATLKVREKIRILRAGPRQNFSPEMVERAVTEGWMSLGKGKLTIHGEHGDVVYRITRAPGYYCCHCAQPLENANEFADAEKTVTKGMAHVADAHQGLPSPHQNNPAGYEKLSAYGCERETPLPAKKGGARG